MSERAAEFIVEGRRLPDIVKQLKRMRVPFELKPYPVAQRYRASTIVVVPERFRAEAAEIIGLDA